VFGPRVAQHGGMLKIGQYILPQNLLSYVAFRTALRHTWDQLDRVVAGALSFDEGHGFLAEVPFLRETPLHIQLDALATSWRKHLSQEAWVADLLDESVIYAACEYTARLSEQQPLRIAWALKNGPFDITVAAEPELAARLRGLCLRWPTEGDVLLLSQLLDLPPHEARVWKEQMGITPQRQEILFETLGRWHVSAQFVHNLQGLITEAESSRLARLVGMACPA